MNTSSSSPDFFALDGMTPEVALWLLRRVSRPPSEVAAILADLCRRLPDPNPALASAILSHLEQEGLSVDDAFISSLETYRATLEQTNQGLLLLAKMAEERGDVKGAIRLFSKLKEEVNNLPCSILLDFARVLTRDGAAMEACIILREVGHSTQDFALLSRASKQLSRLKGHAGGACSRTLKIALLTPYTTDLWIPLLRLALFREGIWADIHVPSYGNHEQAILDPQSSLFAFDPEVVILAPTWRELHLPPFSADPEKVVQEQIEGLVARWKRIQDRVPAHIIQHNFEIPAIDPNGQLGNVMPGGRARILSKINDQLFLEAQASHTVILNLDHLAATHGKSLWTDAGYWHTAKQYPAPSALPVLVNGQVTRIKAGLGLTKKVLVMDLDNTLWGGVIGEEGIKGIQIGPPSATGEAHLALQMYARQLKERGILLAVCSKNNEADAKAPFLEHEGMHLRLDDFVAFTANWEDKATNLRNMAKTLNLGLDSFVFLDDNPIERVLIRQELPEVAVPEIGQDPARFVEILDARKYFDADGLSEEDLERTRNYRKNIERESSRTKAESLDAFLGGLNMTCEHGSLNDLVMPRVVQLLGKTNQFNLTTRRHTDAQIRQMLAIPGTWTHYFRLKDKFDDNGLVGIMIATPSTAEPLVWELDTWLMSCRVIGRQLENFMFNTLMAAARERGVVAIRGLYLPTPKNGMVANLYPELGFLDVSSGSQGTRIFQIDPAQAPLRPAAFIEDRA